MRCVKLRGIFKTQYLCYLQTHQTLRLKLVCICFHACFGLSLFPVRISELHFCLTSSGEASLSCWPDHQPAPQRLSGSHQDAQTNLRAAGVHPRHPPPQQKPHCCPAMPQEEAGLHPEPGKWDPQTGTSWKPGLRVRLLNSITQKPNYCEELKTALMCFYFINNGFPIFSFACWCL